MAKTVLTVDDSGIARDMIDFTLSAAGYRTLTAPGGHEALEIVGRTSVDLVIVDINMPGMDGYTLIRRIRSDDAWEGVPIVIVTTEVEARDKGKGFAAGANAYLVKPVSPDQMVVQVRLLIGDAQDGPQS